MRRTSESSRLMSQVTIDNIQNDKVGNELILEGWNTYQILNETEKQSLLGKFKAALLLNPTLTSITLKFIDIDIIQAIFDTITAAKEKEAEEAEKAEKSEKIDYKINSIKFTVPLTKLLVEKIKVPKGDNLTISVIIDSTLVAKKIANFIPNQLACLELEVKDQKSAKVFVYPKNVKLIKLKQMDDDVIKALCVAIVKRQRKRSKQSDYSEAKFIYGENAEESDRKLNTILQKLGIRLMSRVLIDDKVHSSRESDESSSEAVSLRGKSSGLFKRSNSLRKKHSINKNKKDDVARPKRSTSMGAAPSEKSPPLAQREKGRRQTFVVNPKLERSKGQVYGDSSDLSSTERTDESESTEEQGGVQGINSPVTSARTTPGRTAVWTRVTSPSGASTSDRSLQLMLQEIKRMLAGEFAKIVRGISDLKGRDEGERILAEFARQGDQSIEIVAGQVTRAGKQNEKLIRTIEDHSERVIEALILGNKTLTDKLVAMLNSHESSEGQVSKNLANIMKKLQGIEEFFDAMGKDYDKGDKHRVENKARLEKLYQVLSRLFEKLSSNGVDLQTSAETVHFQLDYPQLSNGEFESISTAVDTLQTDFASKMEGLAKELQVLSSNATQIETQRVRFEAQLSQKEMDLLEKDSKIMALREKNKRLEIKFLQQSKQIEKLQKQQREYEEAAAGRKKQSSLKHQVSNLVKAVEALKQEQTAKLEALGSQITAQEKSEDKTEESSPIKQVIELMTHISKLEKENKDLQEHLDEKLQRIHTLQIEHQKLYDDYRELQAGMGGTPRNDSPRTQSPRGQSPRGQSPRGQSPRKGPIYHSLATSHGARRLERGKRKSLPSPSFFSGSVRKSHSQGSIVVGLSSSPRLGNKKE